MKVVNGTSHPILTLGGQARAVTPAGAPYEGSTARAMERIHNGQRLNDGEQGAEDAFVASDPGATATQCDVRYQVYLDFKTNTCVAYAQATKVSG